MAPKIEKIQSYLSECVQPGEQLLYAAQGKEVMSKAGGAAVAIGAGIFGGTGGMVGAMGGSPCWVGLTDQTITYVWIIVKCCGLSVSFSHLITSITHTMLSFKKTF